MGKPLSVILVKRVFGRKSVGSRRRCSRCRILRRVVREMEDVVWESEK